MAIDFNSSKAFGDGNWRKRLKWQRQTNWWSNSATCRCWRLLDWSSSLRKSGASVPLRQWRLRQDPRQEVGRGGEGPPAGGKRRVGRWFNSIGASKKTQI